MSHGGGSRMSSRCTDAHPGGRSYDAAPKWSADAAAVSTLLARHGLLSAGRRGQRKLACLELRQADAALRVGQGRRILEVVETERGRQIADRVTSPRADVRLGYAGDALEELQLRGVVGHLGVDVPADRPRRNDDARHPEAEPDG